MEKFKSMYPKGIRVIQSYVSEACDRMDYQNSPMYDEWPEQRMVDHMCNSVCQAVGASGDMGVLKDVWEMREKKIMSKMSVEEKNTNPGDEKEIEKKDTKEEERVIGSEELKHMEKDNSDKSEPEVIKENPEKETIEEEELRITDQTVNKESNGELNTEEIKKAGEKEEKCIGQEKETIEKGKMKEEHGLDTEVQEEDINQVTADADLNYNNRMIESQEMRPPLRRWWNGWGINGIGPDVQGMAWGMGPMYVPAGSVRNGKKGEMQGQEMKRPPYGPVPSRPSYGPGPSRPPQAPVPSRPPYGPGPSRPPQAPVPSRPPYGPGPVRPPQAPVPSRPPYGPGPSRPPQAPVPSRPPYGPGPVRPPQVPVPSRPPYGPSPVRPPQVPGSSYPPSMQWDYPAWFRDIVKTLILDEMQSRRCRRGNCI